MIRSNELQSYLNNLLAVERFKDYAPNGLQVQGASTIKVICTAVTASQSAIEAAMKHSAEALLVHHGYFWRGETPVISGMRRERIAALLAHNMNLFAYHLPLDCHLELGNNARIGQLLELKDVTAHSVDAIPDLLWTGFLTQPHNADSLTALLTDKFQRAPLYISGTERPIQFIAWCSGSAQDYIEQAHALGADAYLSGEISERTFYQARELGLHYFSCGHHATERYGIQALGEHLSQQFGLKHYFIDSDNPV